MVTNTVCYDSFWLYRGSLWHLVCTLCPVLCTTLHLKEYLCCTKELLCKKTVFVLYPLSLFQFEVNSALNVCLHFLYTAVTPKLATRWKSHPNTLMVPFKIFLNSLAWKNIQWMGKSIMGKNNNRHNQYFLDYIVNRIYCAINIHYLFTASIASHLFYRRHCLPLIILLNSLRSERMQ